MTASSARLGTEIKNLEKEVAENQEALDKASAQPKSKAKARGRGNLQTNLLIREPCGAIQLRTQHKAWSVCKY